MGRSVKYTNFTSFEKHLVDASHAHLSLVYMVSCHFEPDRKVILDRMLQKFPKEAEVKRFATAKLSELLPLVREMNLFDLPRIFLIYEAEIDTEWLLQFLQNAPPKTFLLLGLISGKEQKIAQETTKFGAVWLDLSREKPWEREKRLVITLREYVLQAGKNIAPDLIERLIHLVGSDWLKLEKEVEKLLLFVGKRQQIISSDLDAIVAGLKELSTWQIAEEIVWGTKGPPPISSIEVGEFLALIGALRYQIQMGWQMASMTLEALPQYFKPYQVQKYGKLAHGKPASYFEKALLELYEVEILAKSTNLNSLLLIAQLIGRMREVYTL